VANVFDIIQVRIRDRKKYAELKSEYTHIEIPSSFFRVLYEDEEEKNVGGEGKLMNHID